MVAASDEMEKALVTGVRAAVALVLLTPLLVMAPPLPNTFFPFIVGKALYARTLAEVAFGFWVVLALRYPAYRPPRSWLLVIFGVYLGITLLAAAYGVSPQRSLWSTYERMLGFVDIAHWFIFTLVLSSVFRSWKQWRWLLNLNLGVGLLMGLLGLAQHFDIQILEFLSQSPRLDITLGNPTYVGAYMLVNLLIALGLLGHSLLGQTRPLFAQSAGRRRRRARRRPASGEGKSLEALWRVFWIAVILLDAWILYLSGTRGAFIGLVAGLLAFAVGYLVWGQVGRVRLASLLLIGSVLGMVLGLILSRSVIAPEGVGSAHEMLSRVAGTGLNDDSLRGRLNSNLVGLRGFAARPALGWGPENFAVAYDRHLTADMVAMSTASFDQAHNKLIEELTTKGILGFSAYIAIWLYMLWVIARRVGQQASQAQIFTLFAGAALTGYFVQNLFLFDTPGTVVQFVLLMGFIVYVDTAPEAAVVSTPESGKAKLESQSGGVASRGYLQSDVSLVVALAIAATLVSVAIHFVNYRPYSGSRTILATLNPSITWEERLDLFDRSIDAFPPLANYPRIVMFDQLTNNWDRLNVEEAKQALEVVNREGLDGIKSEPQEWRLYLPLASLYRKAASLDAGYMARARALVEAAVTLAPQRIEVNVHLVIQRMAEKDYEGARSAIDEYLDRNPRAARRFEVLRVQTQQLLLAQYMAQEDYEGAMDAINTYLREHPDDARFVPTYMALASVYQKATSSHPTYLQEARSLVEKAVELVPETVEVNQHLVRQHIVEKDYEGALAAINKYLQKHPSAANQFEALREEIDSAVGE